MADERWQDMCRQLREMVAPFIGRIEYGDLRVEVYEAEGSGTANSGGRFAIAYEIPGGSTNQVEVSYHDGEFSMLDASGEEEIRLTAAAEVLDRVREHIEQVPSYRRERLHQDIDRWLATGHSRRQVFGELNRLLRLRPEFRGGTLTTDELTDACRYTVHRTEAAGD